jgi:hypothetical protein
MKTLFVLAMMCWACGAQAQWIGSPFAWQQAYGSSGAETGGYAVRLRSGGYVLVGTGVGSSLIHGPLLVVRLTDAGDTLWTRKILPQRVLVITPQGIVQDNNGDLVVSGSCRSANPAASDAFVLKMNTQADTAWVQTFRTPGTDSFGAPLLSSDGNYFAFGWINFQNRIVKINSSSGAVLWNVSVNQGNATLGNYISALALPSGLLQMYMAGSDGTRLVSELVLIDNVGNVAQRKALTFFPGFANMLTSDGSISAGGQMVVKLNQQGDSTWVRRFPPSQTNRGWTAQSVIQDQLGDYVVLAASVGGPASDTQFQLLRFDQQGQLRKDTLLYRTAGSAYPKSILLAPNGDYFMSGYVQNGPRGGNDLVAAQFRRFKPLSTRAPQPLAGALQLYPNPAATTVVRAVIPAGVGRGATLAVLDALGRTVQAQPLAPGNEAVLPTAALGPGVYVVRLRAADGRTWTGRLLRQ